MENYWCQEYLIFFFLNISKRDNPIRTDDIYVSFWKAKKIRQEILSSASKTLAFKTNLEISVGILCSRDIRLLILFFSLSPSNFFYVYVIFYLYIVDNNENMSNLFILNANPKVGIAWICWWSTNYSKSNNLIIRMILWRQRLLKWLL